MKNLIRIKVVAVPSAAMAKLARAGVPVYGCAKQGAYFAFSVPDYFVKKVFAIFASPCYNICVEHASRLARLKNFVFGRVFLLAGCILFAACACISNAFVLRIQVTGSGAYLENTVKGMAYSLGLRENRPYSDCGAQLIPRVLGLPSVTFCSVCKRGSVVYIDVQAEEESAAPAEGVPLTADVCGRLAKLVAVCGTPLVAEGDAVSPGDVLIGAYYAVNDRTIPSLAVGYAAIEAEAGLSFAADCESEQNLENAYAAVLAYTGGEQILSRSHTVKKYAEGVVYQVNFTYLHTISINFD